MDSGGLDIKMLRISSSQLSIVCMLTHAKHASTGDENQYSDRGMANRRHIPSARLAVMCARWFVCLAHATMPWCTRQLLDLIAISVIEFWFLNETRISEQRPLWQKHYAPSYGEQLPDLLRRKDNSCIVRFLQVCFEWLVSAEARGKRAGMIILEGYE
jgi:hypothetical protein